MKFLSFLICLLFSPALLGNGMPGSAGPPAFKSDRTLEQALIEAADNRTELEKALTEAPADQKAGLEFLIRFMPSKDLRSLDAAFLQENLHYAYLARAQHAWAGQVPEAVFFNDVLPYASLDVRRDRWRKDFYERFAPKVAKAKTLREAVLIVNQGIRDELKVDYNTKRKKADQSPYESIESGMASCTGLSVLLCDALRAVGIPARIAGIPMWTTKRGNHNWVEFYDPETSKWHFTEYYLDKQGIDHGWLLADAAKANPDSFFHAIYATSWKPTGTNFPMVWNMNSNEVPAVKVTSRYLEIAKQQGLDKTDAFELRIEFVDENDERMPVEVQLHQLDQLVQQGKTPAKTDDLNRFLSFQIDPAQTYQLIYIYPKPSGQIKSLLVEPTKVQKDIQYRTIRLK